MKIQVKVAGSFLTAVKRLPPDRRKAANYCLEKFMATPDLPGLKFRQLKGFPGFFIISSAHGDRIILRKEAENLFAAVDAGPHDNIYRRWKNR